MISFFVIYFFIGLVVASLGMVITGEVIPMSEFFAATVLWPLIVVVVTFIYIRKITCSD